MRWRAISRFAPFLPLVLLLASAAALATAHHTPGRMMLEKSFAMPSVGHPLGCGEAGVDLLALTSHAMTRAMILAVVVACLGLAVGTPLGAAAGLARGKLELVVVRVCDLVQAFPSFLLALAVLSAVRSPSRWHIGFVFVVTAWAPFARLAVAQARALTSAQFVEAARALGASESVVVLRHVLPNLMGTAVIQLGSSAAAVLLGEAALGFVGLGPSDGISLGALLEQGTASMLRAPHVLAVGAASIALGSGSLQLASEGLRQRLEPRR